MLVALSTQDNVAVDEVGGKAASLIRLTSGGFDVPTGMTLTTDFFGDWVQQLETSSEWQAVTSLLEGFASTQIDLQQRTQLGDACERVKSLASLLQFTDLQRQYIEQIETNLGAGLMAVRSSSPEEDLIGSSFAGLYETVLSVTVPDLQTAIRTCFYSCLDSRVLLYKLEMNFDSFTPAIAVIVQKQVVSNTSGVAFSLNPLTNDYDELLINASWGLGEALVSGDITPDTIVVNKVTDAVIEHRTGDKGGDRSTEKCLDDTQINQIASIVKKIETFYGMPMDVEWAFDGQQLHVLQARPITSFVPLHPSLLTEPGAERHLYMDCYLRDGVTMSAATTPMSNDLFNMVVKLMLEWMFAIPEEDIDPAPAGLHLDTGRAYMNLSYYLPLMGSRELLATQAKRMDPMSAAVLTSPEIEQYIPNRSPRHLSKLRLLFYVPGILWRTRRAIAVLFRPVFKREKFDAEYKRLMAEFEQYIKRPLEYSRPLRESLRDDMVRAGTVTMECTYPAFTYFYIMTERMRRLVDQDSDKQMSLIDAVVGGYEDDMIVNMGLMIYDLAKLLPALEFEDLDALAGKIEQRSLPADFLERWDEFIERYGCRGPLEMELSKTKYGESPAIALQQIASLSNSGSEFNPHDMIQKKIKEREQAFDELQHILSPRKAKKLKRFYGSCRGYAASREYFKHHLMQIYERAKKLLLYRANEFVKAGRMDDPNRIFELTLADVDEATADKNFDIRAAIQERGAYARKLRAQVRHFPMFIDSRGRIFRTAPTIIEGDEHAIVGAAVSPGIARGPIKVLNDPLEKDVKPGDILVAVTTDPGWTPLFINAAAVICNMVLWWLANTVSLVSALSRM